MSEGIGSASKKDLTFFLAPHRRDQTCPRIDEKYSQSIGGLIVNGR